jgi:hypothetical protein
MNMATTVICNGQEDRFAILSVDEEESIKALRGILFDLEMSIQEPSIYSVERALTAIGAIREATRDGPTFRTFSLFGARFEISMGPSLGDRVQLRFKRIDI